MILFDFPYEPSEYIRRVGRTGRAGRTGKATVLVYGKQMLAARAVIQASIDGKRIDPSQKTEADDESFFSSGASPSSKLSPPLHFLRQQKKTAKKK